VKNFLWGAAALAILVLSFTLPLGDFRLSLEHVGRVSKPLTNTSFVDTSKSNNCMSLKFELESRALSLTNFWLACLILCIMGGFVAIVYLQPNHDRFLLVLGVVMTLASFVWNAYAFGQQQRQIGAGQVLYSSHCTDVGNP
jgi:hypothetical protein